MRSLREKAIAPVEQKDPRDRVMDTGSIQGRILHLQRLSTEDGPGIRTTVFFKGCPLRCAWCHNPESIHGQVQLQWYPDRCLGCNTCLETCTEQALLRKGVRLSIERDICTGCGECAKICPANALELLGKTVTIDELRGELIKDKVYYEKSGGGVTLSGGEPGIQPGFAKALMAALHASGIHTALDTCGLLAPDVFEGLLEEADILLFDLKLIDDREHIQFTGQSNRLILSNLVRVARRFSENKRNPVLWIRTPLIPGATANDENILGLGRFIHDNLHDQITRWELCAFNNLCRDKYTRLDLHWDYASLPLLSREEIDHFQMIARSCGLPEERVMATGAVKIAD